MKKFFTRIHLWLSIPFGIIITIICLSGASLVFESEITRVLYPHLYQIKAPTGTAPLEPSQLVACINRQMPDTLHLTSLLLSTRSDEPCMASFRETGRKQLSVNPYTGEVNGWTKKSAFFSTIRKLHRWLLDAPASKGEKSIGKVIVGVSAIGLVVILISGLVIWIPRNRKALKKRMQVSCKHGLHRFWYDSHVALGFYSALFLLVMAMTGLTWSFSWYRTAAYGLFGGSQQSVAMQPTREKSHSEGDNSHNRKRHASYNYTIWDKVFTQLAARYPAHKTILLAQKEAQVSSSSTMRRTDRIAFDPQSGCLGEVTPYEDTPRQQKLHGWFYAFHTGSWGGAWSKSLYFLAALIGGTLPLTGYYLWWKRKNNGRTK